MVCACTCRYHLPWVFAAVSGWTACWALGCFSACTQSVPSLVCSLVPQFLAVLNVYLLEFALLGLYFC